MYPKRVDLPDALDFGKPVSRVLAGMLVAAMVSPHHGTPHWEIVTYAPTPAPRPQAAVTTSAQTVIDLPRWR